MVSQDAKIRSTIGKHVIADNGKHAKLETDIKGKREELWHQSSPKPISGSQTLYTIRLSYEARRGD